jgi:hypothetical protein
MPFYVVFHKDQQIRVFPHEILGDDWKRARILAIAMAEKAEQNGYHYTVEHFDGISGVGVTIWK